ncbi:uncharacterized protein GGS25DRAFT_151913 [Hypoxylon fragiforme]|uniref:uncharacterized protein n=1 Tax=Hypoxylon fragiforme TaxID=63214 RepID=UPI0020C5E8EC|nr:uncharacterized protein GGS25DRAFT_151913 [Hypoxylon fragiforme]KAI2613147.1 hypothetical protein GGS25DRAFT_151913 [Hypoxylon fragiforme]
MVDLMLVHLNSLFSTAAFLSLCVPTIPANYLPYHHHHHHNHILLYLQHSERVVLTLSPFSPTHSIFSYFSYLFEFYEIYISSIIINTFASSFQPRRLLSFFRC